MLCISATERLKQNPGRGEKKQTGTVKKHNSKATRLPRRDWSAVKDGNRNLWAACDFPHAESAVACLWPTKHREGSGYTTRSRTFKGSLTPFGWRRHSGGSCSRRKPPQPVSGRDRPPCFMARPLVLWLGPCKSGERPGHSHRETGVEGKGRTILPQL